MPMNMFEYRDVVMGHVNNLLAVHRSSTPETWPALRDAELKRQAMEGLNHLEFAEATQTEGVPTIH